MKSEPSHQRHARDLVRRLDWNGGALLILTSRCCRLWQRLRLLPSFPPLSCRVLCPVEISCRGALLQGRGAGESPPPILRVRFTSRRDYAAKCIPSRR
jgi:hypothetical protein